MESQASSEGRHDRHAHALGNLPWARAGQQAAETLSGVRRLTDKLAVVDAGGANVVALSTDAGLLLVDSGVAGYGDPLVAALNGLAGNSNVHTLFNTHYHLEN